MFNQHLQPYLKKIITIIDQANLENPTSQKVSLILRRFIFDLQATYQHNTTPENIYRRLATINCLVSYHLLILPKQQKLENNSSNWLRKISGLSKTQNYISKLEKLLYGLSQHLSTFESDNEKLPHEVISRLKALLEYNKMHIGLTRRNNYQQFVPEIHNNELIALIKRESYPECNNFELIEHYAAAHCLLLETINHGYYLRDNNNSKKIWQWTSAGLVLSNFIGGSLTLLGSLVIGLYQCDKASYYENTLHDIINTLAKKNAHAFAELLDAYPQESTMTLPPTKLLPPDCNQPEKHLNKCL